MNDCALEDNNAVLFNKPAAIQSQGSIPRSRKRDLRSQNIKNDPVPSPYPTPKPSLIPIPKALSQVLEKKRRPKPAPLKERVNTFTCRLCTKIFYRIADLQNHVRLVHPEDCHKGPSIGAPTQKGVTFMNGIFQEDAAQQFVQSFPTVAEYPCSLCPKRFFSHKQLEAHFAHHEVASYLMQGRVLKIINQKNCVSETPNT